MEPKYPWLIEANDRYREVLRTTITLSTAALVIPVFFLTKFPDQSEPTMINTLLSWKVYLSWTFLSLSIVMGLLFYYVSAAWVWVAWGQRAYFFGRMYDHSDWKIVNKWLIGSFWSSILFFLLGLAFAIWFMAACCI